jgi:hypothetical protein
MPNISSVEEMRDYVIAQTKTIIPDNAYRSNVGENVITYFAEVKNITHFPTVAILLGTENVKSDDANASVWESNIDVMFIGYVKVEDCEPLIHDIKRLIAGMILSNANVPENRWVVNATEMGDGMLRIGRYFLAGAKTGFCSVTMQVKVMNQDSTFSPLDLNAEG